MTYDTDTAKDILNTGEPSPGSGAHSTKDGERLPHTPADAAVVVRRLRLATGFLATERGWVSESLTALGPPLRSFRDDQIDLEISVKDRQGTGQRLTLECWIDHRPRLHFVATSSQRDLPTALSEVCDELIRQVDTAKTRTDPRSNRALRLVPALPRHEQVHAAGRVS